MIKVAIYVYVTDEVDISNQLVNAFQIRVGAAGGVVEASECLLTQLESIGYSGTIPVAKRLELFNDEKISVNSTIQNISDISKIYTDFSQGFTIPCSTVNNEIFQHFYQNDVDATIDYQFRFDAYIEIDTKLFRRGKIQFEKANLKNGYPDSYSITFYGNGVSLKDTFLEDKLSQLNYSTLDHNYTNAEVYNRVTIDSSVTDYNVRYPLISSNRVWQFSGSTPLPDANVPSWYDNSPDNSKNINHASGEIVYTELFPAVRVASIFDLIESKYGITFNGLFLLSDFFRKAFLLYKNKDNVSLMSSPVNLDILSNFSIFNSTNNTLLETGYPDYMTLKMNVTSLSISPTQYYIDAYLNGVFSQSFQGTTTGSTGQFVISNFTPNQVLTFKVRSIGSITINITFNYETQVWDDFNQNFIVTTSTGTATVLTTALSNLSALAPDMKIVDFISGICKEFNLTVYSNTENVYTFDPIDYWYQGGAVIDITEYTDVTSIEVERMKLYKSIEFKYQDSECMLNKYFLESPLNADAHGYGNTKIGFNYDGGEFKIESPFENLLHNNFGNNLQVGYCLNKELAPYIPKPVLLYMNKKATLTSGHIHWDGQANITGYVPFGQDAQTLSQTGLINFSLNFGSEISTFYLVNNQYTIYDLYYKNYLVNLYNPKNRLVKVKTILPVSLLTNLKLNDRLIIRDKRYFINEMKTELTTREVDFTLISDFNPVKPTTFSQVPDDVSTELKFAIIFSNDVFKVTAIANTVDVILSETVFTNEDFLTVTTPNFNIGKLIQITLLSEFNNGNTETDYIIIEQI
jgi:hypothetical protein